MKVIPRYYFLLLCGFFLLTVRLIYAQDLPTLNPNRSPSITPATNEDVGTDSIQRIKETIANTIAKKSSTGSESLSGFIDNIDDGMYTIISKDKKKKISISEELTIFIESTPQKESTIKSSDIEEGIYVTAFGFTLDNEFSANFVIKQKKYKILEGQITDINSDDYTLDVITFSKDEVVVNIETNTSQQIVDAKTLETSKAGFSKYKIGDRIHAVIVYEEKTSSFSAERILIIPQEYFTD